MFKLQVLGKGVNHSVLILIGGQGTGKTTFLNRLAIDPEYVFCGSIDPRNKDSRIICAEKQIINLDELESSTKNDWSFIKSLVTLPKITERRPYARRAEELPRRASFCASVNNSQILSDLTGSRRWLCIETESIDFNKVTPELMKNVYTQALASFNTGKKYWFDHEEIIGIDGMNEEFHQSQPEEEILLEMFKPIGIDNNALFLTNSEIIQEMKGKYTAFNFRPKQLGQALKKHGFLRAMRRDKVYAYKLCKKERRIVR